MKIDSLPWHVNVDAQGYKETSANIEASIDSLIDNEQKYGAEFYAGVANEAAEMINYGDDAKVEIDEDAQEAAEEFVEQVAHDRSKGSGQALYGLVADAHDALRTYEEAHGEQNVEALDDHVTQIREAWNNA